MPEKISLVRESPPPSKISTPPFLRERIEQFCLRDDLSTYDPYDIWKTPAGFRVKRFYNSHPRLGLLPAAGLTLFDTVINNRSRWFYRKAEYPIVRAQAALALLNLYESSGTEAYARQAFTHLQWLAEHRCAGYRGCCWGLGFANSITRDILYQAGTPYTTMTPYPLEAMVRYRGLTGDSSLDSTIAGVRRFFDEDVFVMHEDAETMATSYAPFRDRIVTNAVSYAMFSYTLLLDFAPVTERLELRTRIRKLYEFVRRQQRADGSWLYSPQGSSFVDCFHSCIILKNLIKTARCVALDGAAAVIESGWSYLKRTLFDSREMLFRRFSIANKPGFVRFDLYDNAEALNLAILSGERDFAARIAASIERHFVRPDGIYSQIDRFGWLRNRNTLRWAVMPFLCAASSL
jgi:hypothetical protein